jgi:Flp pilus assembly protein TadG
MQGVHVKARRTTAGRNRESGLVITLVAVVLLFVVGAMAVLAIDVATFYTARSEAQSAAESAALSAARALANSGMTSNPADTDLAADAERIAANLALQVATNNEVGGRDLQGAVNCSNEVCVTFNDGDPTFGTNPRATVTVTRSDLPTFFARIWGKNLVTVQASAVAEAYNPSGVNVAVGGAIPVAPTCVKPWVLPNMSPLDPSNSTPIFDPTTGAIQNASSLLGWEDTTPLFNAACQNSGPGPSCLPTWPQPKRWSYYPGTTSGGTPSFPAPTQALPDCSFGTLTAYQATIASCVTTPIACNSTVTLDQTDPGRRNRPTVEAVNCLTHAENNQGDKSQSPHRTSHFSSWPGLIIRYRD